MISSRVGAVVRVVQGAWCGVWVQVLVLFLLLLLLLLSTEVGRRSGQAHDQWAVAAPQRERAGSVLGPG